MWSSVQVILIFQVHQTCPAVSQHAFSWDFPHLGPQTEIPSELQYLIFGCDCGWSPEIHKEYKMEESSIRMKTWMEVKAIHTQDRAVSLQIPLQKCNYLEGN